MFYVLSRIFGTIAQPGGLLLLVCIVGAVISLWRPRSSWGRTLLITGVAGLSACALLPVGTWLMRPLEDRFPPLLHLPAHVDGIILLGGAIDLRESADRNTPVLNERAERLTAFVALARLYPHAPLLFTGGNPELFPAGPTEADMARVLFAGLGLDLRRVRFENKSRNTYENALFSRLLVHVHSDQHWVLVTSAADMPRAVGCFRAVGWPVIAFPTDYHTRRLGMGAIPGLVSGLRNVDWAAHEWIGLIYYRAHGWTASFFPGP